MAMSLTQKPCAFCPDACSAADLSLEEVSFFGDNLLIIRDYKITCKHERACTMWTAMLNPEKKEEK